MAVTVESVNEDGPSQGKLQDGDAIDGVNGKPVAKLDEFQALLKDTKPGDTVTLDYRRKNGDLGVATITLGKHPERDQGYLGIGVLDAPWAPFTVDFNLANIGGPSAGLMFSLAVVDKLTTGDLNDGKFVAGTGTITGDGKVGPIGGITHKMLAAQEAGATIFLVPADNCEEAKTAHDDRLELVKVENLDRGRGRTEDTCQPVANAPDAEPSPHCSCVELGHVGEDVWDRLETGVDEWVCGPRHECRS